MTTQDARKESGKVTQIGSIRMIDADSHWDENPTDMWQRRIPSKFHDDLPQVEIDGVGREFLSYSGGAVKVMIRRGERPAGTDPNPEMNPKERASTGLGARLDDPVQQRLADMDADGVSASVVYSLNGNALNKAYGDRPDTLKAYIRAYNEWLAEEVCAPSGGRLNAMGIQAWTNARDAVAELENCVKIGLRGLNLGRWPNGSQLPDESDDYFWAAAEEMGVPISIHVVNDFVAGNINFTGKLKSMDKDQLSLGTINTTGASTIPIVDVMLGIGLAERFPKLKIGLIEANIGWIPNYLAQADYYWLHYRYTVGKSHFKLLPSQAFRQNFYTSFIYDPIGVQMRDHIGVDRIMWSTDFPHGITEWPHTRRLARELFTGVPEDEVKLMLFENARRFYGLGDV